MSVGTLPTIWELVEEGASTLPEPFSRAALINWVSARRPDVGVSSIAAHIQFATVNTGASGHNPFAGRTPLLERVDRGRYVRFREPSADAPGGAPRPGVVRAQRVLLVGSSGVSGADPMPAAEMFHSDGFRRSRDLAVRSGLPWFVVTAKHGLLDPDDVIGPSEVDLGDQSITYRTAWGEWVAAQLGDRVQLRGVTVEVHGGVDFAQPLRQPLARRGAALEIPLPGTWQETGPGWPAPHDEQHPHGEAPVRAALVRLRELVHRHRAHPDSSAS
ncbi:MAG TPA: hypothetical protein VK279_09865 [Solirubrobacteraceae bacterium]|nr:hypothetical protein [Solirubrobacteraceae bacterium]